MNDTSTAVIRALIDGILKFHDALVGHEFYTYQQVFTRRILEALLTNDPSTITGLWCRQSGKTTSSAELNMTAALLLPVLAKNLPHIEALQKFRDGLRVGIFAPIQEQAQLSYDKMRDIVHSDRAEEVLADPEIGIEIISSRGNALSLSNNSLVHAKTASPDSKVEGFTYHLILIDEAQAVDRFKVEKEIEPMRAATNGVLVKIGTAFLSRGGFHSDIEHNVENFKRGWRCPKHFFVVEFAPGKCSECGLTLVRHPRNHFEFPYDIVIKEKRRAYEKTRDPFHLNYESYVRQQIRRLGLDSLSFRMNFMLKWQESRMDAISVKALADGQDKSRELNVPYVPKTGEARDRYVHVAGIDVGKTNDPTVVSVVEVDMLDPIRIKDVTSGDTITYYRTRCVALKQLDGNFEDSPEGTHGQYTEVVAFVREWHVRKICVDATAIGDPVFERFQVLAPEIDWEAIHYSTPMKSNLFKHYLGEWEAGRFRIASGGKSKEMSEWMQFFDEHKTLEKEWIGQYLSCHAPEPTSSAKSIPGQSEYHDDYPNATALAMWAAKSDIMMEIHVDGPTTATATSTRTIPVSAGHSRYKRRW